MPVVFYDSNAILEHNFDITALDASGDDGIVATRQMWFNYSSLSTIVGSTLGPQCKLKHVDISVERDPQKLYIEHANTGGAGEIDGVIVSITFTPSVTASNVVDPNFGVRPNSAATVHEVTNNTPIASNVYDLALGCYTWEQIYTTPHPVLTTQTATNGANATAFANLIYNDAALTATRNSQMTDMYKKIYEQLLGVSEFGDGEGRSVREVKHADDGSGALLGGPGNTLGTFDADGKHRIELYVALKRDGSGLSVITEGTGQHEVEWYINHGNVDTGVTATKIDTVDTTGQVVAGRFWRDMITEHVDLSGNVNFGTYEDTPTDDRFRLVAQSSELNEGKPTYALNDDKKIKKNLSSMIVHILNPWFDRANTGVDIAGTNYSENWVQWNTSGTIVNQFGRLDYTDSDSITPQLGHRLTGNTFETMHHFRHTGMTNMVFERNSVAGIPAAIGSGSAASTAWYTPGGFGKLVRFDIPVRSSNYGNAGIDTSSTGADGSTYELALRANMNITFETADDLVFYGQKTGTVDSLMFAMFVEPEDPVNTNRLIVSSGDINSKYLDAVATQSAAAAQVAGINHVKELITSIGSLPGVAAGAEYSTLMDTADAIYETGGLHVDSYNTMITANNTVESEITDFVALAYRADTAMDTDTLAALNAEANTNLTSVQNYAAAVNVQNNLLNEAFKDPGGAINSMFNRVRMATTGFNASDLSPNILNYERANQWHMTATEAADEKLIVGTYHDTDLGGTLFQFKETDITTILGVGSRPDTMYIQLPTGVIYTLAYASTTGNIVTYSDPTPAGADVPTTTTITCGLISESSILLPSLNRFNDSIELTERMLDMLRTKVEDVWTANNTGASAFETPTDIREAITAAETYLTSIKSDVREQTVDLIGYRNVMITERGDIETEYGDTTGYVGGEIVGRDSIVSFYSNKVAYSALMTSLNTIHSDGAESVNVSIDDVLDKMTERMETGINWANADIDAFFS
jgi:hypothetical protein